MKMLKGLFMTFVITVAIFCVTPWAYDVADKLNAKLTSIREGGRIDRRYAVVSLKE